ncbi:hypothetical protein OUZ56_005493 [Daphnia magna]|uniref:Uncharacterized protein n=1 Tax=Daphnia magna TaxID=35525 RepID=A0ABQ9YTN4_9CRUS|nr:hypothetical protein OUZ56_005493 [Daphnia magna]
MPNLIRYPTLATSQFLNHPRTVRVAKGIQNTFISQEVWNANLMANSFGFQFRTVSTFALGVWGSILETICFIRKSKLYLMINGFGKLQHCNCFEYKLKLHCDEYMMTFKRLQNLPEIEHLIRMPEWEAGGWLMGSLKAFKDVSYNYTQHYLWYPSRTTVRIVLTASDNNASVFAYDINHKLLPLFLSFGFSYNTADLQYIKQGNPQTATEDREAY